jgi:hypothetical protein
VEEEEEEEQEEAEYNLEIFRSKLTILKKGRRKSTRDALKAIKGLDLFLS